MHCAQCNKPATCVGDRHLDGKTVSRELLCSECASKPDIDLIADEQDFVPIMSSGTCWCDGAMRCGVALHYCPKCGEHPLTKPKE